MTYALPARVPVLVVGGGPSGLAAAIELGRRDVPVVVVEPRTDLDPLRARAKTTSVRTMEHLRRWGVAETLRAAAPLPVAHAQDVVFCTSLLGREVTRFPDAFGLTTERPEDFAEPGQQAPQPVVEQVLRDAAASLSSVTLLLGWRALSVSDGPDGVATVLTDPTGEEHHLTADWLLGCDGSSGITRLAIGARYEGSSGVLPNLSITFRSPDLEQRDLGPEAIHYWILGTTGGLMGRLDLAGTWWAIVHGVTDVADPASLVQSLVGAPIDVEVLATDPWQARMLLVDRYRGNRVFLLGDAAHLNPPWGGHGFNTCLGDAVNLGWKLAAVLQGWAPETLLDTYETERRPVAARTIDAAASQEEFLAPSFATPLLEDDGPAGEAARAEVAKRLQESKDPEFHSLGLVLGYDYPDSSAVVQDGRPVPSPDVARFSPSAHPGARLPHRWLPDGSAVYDRLGDGFTLLRLNPSQDVDALVEEAGTRHTPLTVVDLPASLVETYGADLVLVRPDQHVAWRGSQLTDAGAVLATITGARNAEALLS